MFSDGTGKGHNINDFNFTWSVKDSETVELLFVESGKTVLATWNGSNLKYSINDYDFTWTPKS